MANLAPPSISSVLASSSRSSSPSSSSSPASSSSGSGSFSSSGSSNKAVDASKFVQSTGVYSLQNAQNAISSTFAQAPTQTVNGVKLSVPANNSMYSIPDTQKIQVGKLVSNFKTGFSGSGGDIATYRNNINYGSLSKKEKVVADNLFDAEKKKKDEEDNFVPVSNTTNRTGLKIVTPVVPPDSVAGIRAATGMSIADARAESLRRRSAGFVPANAVVDTNPDTQYITESEDVVNKMKEQADADKAEQIAAMENNRLIAQQYNDSLIADNQNALYTFEAEQDKLLKGYEGNRLNQVQGDLRRILLERGVDVSKVTPEQLIALSGTVGVNAFKDVSSAKERATAAIETARQNALAKVSQLKSNNVLNQTQYNTAIADINSKTESQKNNLDLKLAELKFGVLTNAAATAKTDAQAVAQNVLATAQALGVTGTQMGLVQSFIKNAKSTPEAISRLLAELQNPNSPLYTTLKSNENATSKAAQFNAALKQYEAETDRLKAQASVTSANRPRSSGSATVVYANTAANQK